VEAAGGEREGRKQRTKRNETNLNVMYFDYKKKRKKGKR
jgi:hypothetical protein